MSKMGNELEKRISLYECYNARCGKNGYIYCAEGHKLGNDNIHIRQVERGDRLIVRACQNCELVDYEPMEYPDERGWK